MIDLPAYTAHREWLAVRAETPIFWRLIMDTACHHCDHSPLTPIDGHGHYDHDIDLMLGRPPRILGVVGLVNPRVIYGP